MSALRSPGPDDLQRWGGDTRKNEPMLNQVADGVWVRQSAWVLSNAIAVRGELG